MAKSVHWRHPKANKMWLSLALVLESLAQRADSVPMRETSHPYKVCKLLKAPLSEPLRATSQLCRPLRAHRMERSLRWRPLKARKMA